MELDPSKPKGKTLSRREAIDAITRFNENDISLPEDIHGVGVVKIDDQDSYAIGIFVEPGADATVFGEETFGDAMLVITETEEAQR